MIFVNQSVGFLQNDIIESFSNDENLLLFCGSDVKRIPKNVKIIKSIPYSKKNIFTRFLTWAGFSIHFILFLLFTKNKMEPLFIVSNPPLTPLLSFITKRKCYLLIYDLYPDVLIHTGILSNNNLLINLWVRLNKISFKKARIVFTISDSMRIELSKYVDNKKIKVIYNWSQNFDNKLKFLPKDQFIDIHGKFIILYSGNIGLTHDIETLIYAAKEIKEKIIYSNIHFVFNGNGLQKDKLIKIAQENKLSNVTFFDYLDDDTFNALLKHSKIGVVSISGQLDKNILPSKVYNYLASNLALICICSPNSELSNFTDKHNVGLVSDNFDISKLTNNILFLYQNPDSLNIFANNSKSISSLFTKKNAQLFYKEIENDNVTEK
jgi:glycosyltransferase involved in cell wall biosynthesis